MLLLCLFVRHGIDFISDENGLEIKIAIAIAIATAIVKLTHTAH